MEKSVKRVKTIWPLWISVKSLQMDFSKLYEIKMYYIII